MLLLAYLCDLLAIINLKIVVIKNNNNKKMHGTRENYGSIT